MFILQALLTVFLICILSTTHAHFSCGTREPSLEEMLAQEEKQSRRRFLSPKKTCDELCKGCIVVDMVFHPLWANLDIYQNRTFYSVIPAPRSTMDRLFDRDRTLQIDDFWTFDQLTTNIQANMAVLNRAFDETPFQFQGTIRDYRDEPTDSRWQLYAGDNVVEISQQYGVANMSVVNVFLTYAVDKRSDTEPILAFASLPFEHRVGDGDGIFSRYDVLTNGDSFQTSLGYVLVHEVS